jgi:aromatic-L-amino-acid decarboxylase
MLLRAYGKKKYGTLIQQNLDQTKYLAELVEEEPEMELTASVASNVLCFRYRPATLNEEELENLNKKILDDLNEKAFLMISDTTIKGKYMLRACNVNHRTQKRDLDYLVAEVKKVGRKNFCLMQHAARRAA